MTAPTNAVEMNDIELKFGTNTNSIDANTLINSIIHFTNLIQEVNSELDPGRKINIKVSAIEPGSFIVNMVIESGVIQSISHLFTGENISYLADLSATIAGVYALTKFLKGEKPKDIEKKKDGIHLENIDGSVTIIDNRVFNVYEKPVVKQILSKGFETLQNDSEVQSFDINDKNGDNIVEFEREEFSNIANLESTPEAVSRINPKEAILNIITLSFDPKKKWEFMYDGHKILANIKDEIFFEHIDKGEAFAKGDTLKVEMEITQHYNDLAQAYGNHSYKVVKIIEHTKRPEQGKIF